MPAKTDTVREMELYADLPSIAGRPLNFVYFGGGTLNIDASRINNNDATGGLGGNGPGNQQNGGGGGSAQGGGAYVVGGTATINNTTFESCAATGGNSGTGQNGGNFGGESGGGGLYSLGTVTVTNSTFDLNSATGGRGGDSFGPDCFGAHESFDGGAARGGAILADGGSLIINTATFASNSASGGNGGDGGKTGGGSCSGTQHGAGGLAFGGAITNNNSATMNIKHATISLNSAQAGNSASGTIIPDKGLTSTTAMYAPRRVFRAVTTTLSSTVNALDNSTVSTIDTANSPMAAMPEGKRQDQSARPTRGSKMPATTNIGTARKVLLATREAMARINQSEWVSTGRRRS
jgi:hypothetical protein